MFSKINNYIREVNTEMRKVSWSTRQELIGSTLIVIISLAFLTIFIAICDLIISKVIGILIR